MPKQPRVSAEFLADFDVVCPQMENVNLPSAFLEDLECAYAQALSSSPPEPAISTDDLSSLARALEAWRRKYQNLLQKYLARLPDDDPVRSPVSLFRTMDFGRLEIAHTRTLAWLLNDQEHGFGFQLLEALLLHLLKDKTIRRIRVDRVESEHPVRGGRIDILAESHWQKSGNDVAWRLVIEAKIDAEEGEKQLSLYDAWLERQSKPAEVLRVFLTPDEDREPLTGSARWQPLSFLDLARIFHHTSPGLQGKPGYHFLRYYLAGVLREICELPIPFSSDCKDPYAAVDYLKSVLGVRETEDGHGHSR